MQRQMLEFIKRPEFEKYIQSYKADTILFAEGDSSQDLYILISGKVGLLKSAKKISEIAEPGSLFGEISFLLHRKRSLAAKANSDVEALVIPSSEVSSFLEEFPAIAPEITRQLAKRLLETTQVVHCYKEFCDQLPDAVIMTDKDLKILAWNTAAEKLYGRSWNQMRGKSINEIYENQATFQQFIEELTDQKTVRERPLKIIHPLENWRFVSTSTTALYNADQNNIEGYIFLGRDATKEQTLQKKQLYMKNLFVPAVALIVVLLASIFWNMPENSRGVKLLEHRKEVFAERLANDYPSLSLSLGSLVADGKLAETTRFMEEYFKDRDPSLFGIKGLVLLDTDKNVVNAYSLQIDEDTANLLGSSYAGLVFHETKGAHNIISMHKASRSSEGGYEIEIAFKLNKDHDFLGWLVFQLDMKVLSREFGLRPKDLNSLLLVR